NAIPYERVSITSFDGLRLNGRYYNVRDGAPLVLMCHGYRGTPSRDFSGGADLCMGLGYNVLIIEERAHCSSEGHTISFGINERRDCVDWCRFAAERFRTPIILVGISMGAATVLMASALELPENVRGIIADCPFTSPKAIIRKVGAVQGFPLGLTMPLAELGARVFGGFSLSTPADAAEAVKRAKVPVLLIHGEADNFVPCVMSREIAAANPALVELHTFPDAWHGASYLTDTPRYTRLVKDFCRRVLDE
ncbi:MAG: alpha/beta fold hydrolase, partial [Oscillospiraceae bacterium]|nr:alpha/beta fold hydrolase [Oscillospiraceae bacterium]